MATTTRTRKKPATKARPAAKKARAAKKRTTRAVKRAPAAKAVKKSVRTAKKRTTTAKRTAKRTATSTVRTAQKRAGAAKKSARHTARTNVRKVAKAVSPARSNGARAGGRRQDAIALLKQDHRDVNALFRQFEQAGPSARAKKGRLAASMIEALSRHAAIEELAFYPAVRREVAGTTSDVLEAIEEHHVVKWLLYELDGLDPANERFDAKVTVLIESVRHHVREEENELFPRVRARLGRERLLAIGDELRDAKPRVSARPHPRAPDEPPANLIVAGAVGAIDRARKVGKQAVERVRDELPV
jgi:hemerythrin-like domain-containing protein